MPFQSSIPSGNPLRLSDLFPHDAKLYTAKQPFPLMDIRPGDILVVDPTARPHRKSIVLAAWHEGMTIRELWKCSDGMEYRGTVLARIRRFE